MNMKKEFLFAIIIKQQFYNKIKFDLTPSAMFVMRIFIDSKLNNKIEKKKNIMQI